LKYKNIGGKFVRNFISLLDYTIEELTEILNRADHLEVAWKENKMPKSLINRQIGLWFYGQGFRNRVAFEIGAKAMGAQISYIPGELGIHEPLVDIGHYLENWYSLLIIRAKKHDDLLYLSENTTIPVINARTDFSHPCEIMGDLQFIRKYRGSINDLNVVFVGEVTNLCMSWFEAAVRFPIKVTQVAPASYLANNEIVDGLNEKAKGRIDTNIELMQLLKGADLIYTDCWPRTNDIETKDTIRRQFLPYQITIECLSKLKENSMFLPCPPVTRGEEVTNEAMESELCLNYRAKEYLLHSQNSIMEFLCNEA
jgi:ornithine carbamoyltransferase